MKNSLTLLSLYIYFMSVSIFSQLEKPINNCNRKASNSEVNVCNSNKQTYDACLCRYEKELKTFYKKLNEYEAKRFNIDQQIRNLDRINNINSFDFLEQKKLTKKNGFYKKRQEMLNKLESNFHTASLGLSLSREKSRYCVKKGCADFDINNFQRILKDVEKEKVKLSKVKPYAGNISISLNNKISNSVKNTENNEVFQNSTKNFSTKNYANNAIWFKGNATTKTKNWSSAPIFLLIKECNCNPNQYANTIFKQLENLLLESFEPSTYIAHNLDQGIKSIIPNSIEIEDYFNKSQSKYGFFEIDNKANGMYGKEKVLKNISGYSNEPKQISVSVSKNKHSYYGFDLYFDCNTKKLILYHEK